MKELLETLKEGKIAIIPTDTVYGLVGDATNESVIKNIYEVKKRDKNKPLLILVSDLEMLKDYIKSLKDLEEKIINKFWPGPLTILLSKNENVSNTLTSNKDSVGVRLPDKEDLRCLISKLGKPIIATSANITGKETITNISELEPAIKDNVDLIIDDGTINAISSTIIKVQNNKIIFLREGLLTNDIKKEFAEYL